MNIWTTILKIQVFLLLTVITGAISFYLAPRAYYKVYPFAPVTNINSPFPVDRTTVKPGDKISWTASFCKNDNAPARTKVVLSSKLKQQSLYEGEFNGDKQCYSATRSVVIPLDTPAGETEIDFITDYTYPYDRKIQVRARTVTFNVE